MDNQNDDIVEYPIDGELDLHRFNPREVKSLVPEYLEVCRQKGIYQVRIVHGKGKGVLRETVHAILRRHPHVIRFWQEGSAGSWGATLVQLAPLKPQKHEQPK
jgi:DNA-nicking Smr family endonuclease